MVREFVEVWYLVLSPVSCCTERAPEPVATGPNGVRGRVSVGKGILDSGNNVWASLAGAVTEKLSGDVAVLESGCSVSIVTRLLEAEGKSDAIPLRSSMISDCAVVDVDVRVAGR